MALDILHDNWGPYTHTEVENALKAYLSVLENRINRAIQSGGVGLADLSTEVKALLNKANTALQPENIAAWAKAQNKPSYTVNEITYSDLLTLAEKLADMDQKIQEAAQSGGTTPDAALSDTSENAVQNKVVKAAFDILRRYVDDAVDDKLTEVTVNAVGNSASMYFAGSALCISTANLIQVTATPTITYVDNEQNVVVSISGSGTLKAYLDGVEQTLVNGSFTIAKTSVAQNVVVTATAKEDGKAISAEAELTIEVGAYIDRSKMLTGFGTNSTDFPIYLDGSSEPSFTAVVDAEHPFTKYGETMYNWSVDFSEEETQPTQLFNAVNRNIFVNTNLSYASSIYGITHIPDSVTTLLRTFQNCTNLKDVELGNVATLDMAFRNTALAGSVDFSNSMLQIADNQAFRDCRGITSIKFPSMFMRLGGNAMSGCSNLTSITFLGNTAPTIIASSTANNALIFCSALSHIYVPIGTRSAYVTAFTSALGFLEKSTDIIEEISE